MSKLKVWGFGVSIDGFGAGPNQSMDNPMGMEGMSLHDWILPTKTFQEMNLEMVGSGETEGTTGIDDDFAARGVENLGAWIMGRNMFGPMRGPWEDYTYKGWWGDNPPFHTPVYILTHFDRPSIEMAGETIFHFVTDGIEGALQLARAAAGEKDIRLGGGPNTIRQYLSSKLVDEMHIAVTPGFLGSGESLWHGLNIPELGYECVEYVPSENAAHIVFRKR